ncbi:MAG: hypothetical protein AAGI30_11785 [Planctomycetota bacterium]
MTGNDRIDNAMTRLRLLRLERLGVLLNVGHHDDTDVDVLYNALRTGSFDDFVKRNVRRLIDVLPSASSIDDDAVVIGWLFAHPDVLASGGERARAFGTLDPALACEIEAKAPIDESDEDEASGGVDHAQLEREAALRSRVMHPTMSLTKKERRVVEMIASLLSNAESQANVIDDIVRPNNQRLNYSRLQRWLASKGVQVDRKTIKSAVHTVQEPINGD